MFISLIDKLTIIRDEIENSQAIKILFNKLFNIK